MPFQNDLFFYFIKKKDHLLLSYQKKKDPSSFFDKVRFFKLILKLGK